MKKLMVLTAVVALVVCLCSTASAGLFRHHASQTCTACAPAACQPAAPAPAPCKPAAPAVVCEQGKCHLCPLKKLAECVKEKRCEKAAVCQACPTCPKACTPIAPAPKACAPVTKAPKPCAPVAAVPKACAPVACCEVKHHRLFGRRCCR